MALINSNFDAFFLKTIRALEPYLDRIVIAGGCANALYRFATGVNAAPQPLATYDVDVTTPNDMHVEEIPLAESLIQADLRPVSQRTNKYATTPEAREKLEILCPTVGLPRKMKEEVPILVDIQPGVAAEALDFVELLLLQPLHIDLRAISSLGVKESLVVHVPHPLLYVLYPRSSIEIASDTSGVPPNSGAILRATGRLIDALNKALDGLA